MKNSTLDPPQSSDEATQHSSSQNLIYKVQDWQDWTYADGSPKKHEKGKTQDQVYTTLA
jgi:hypothetical protein